MTKKCSVIILSAGKSQRMNFPKAFLFFNSEKTTTFIEQIISVYLQFGCEQIISVLNPENFCTAKELNLKSDLVINNNFEKGRFSSIAEGTKELNPDNYCFIQNIDNPFITVSILEKIFMAREKNSYISPRYKNHGGHPILLSPQIITEIQAEKSENQNFRNFLQPFFRKNVYINNKAILININTQKEYNQFFYQKNKTN